MISVIITVHNEKEHLANTIASVRANTDDCEIVVVDDGSGDGCCDNLEGVDTIVRHGERVGIAASRNEGAAIARGDTLAFLDGHHLLSEGCLNKCADVAVERQAIAWPCVRGLEDKKRNWLGHGAEMRQSDEPKKSGLFSLKWITRAPKEPVSRCTTMVVPGYVMPRTVYDQVRWIDGLQGWGASEPAITVKAWFLGIDILHVCGPLCRHYFRPGLTIPYPTRWKAVARNHGLVARVCFTRRTFQQYWVPRVFQRWLDKDARIAAFYNDEIERQHQEFQARKRRPDAEFWSELLRLPIPKGVMR